MTYTSLLPYYRKLALAQGPLTANPILPWFSGNTGYSHSYGHRHTHLVSESWARAVIQCYAARPAFYDDAPSRYSGYSGPQDSAGCRPMGWTLDTADATTDSPNGPAVYGDVYVSGPDGEHIPLSPLIALYDHGGAIPIKLPSGLYAPASDVAADLLRRLSAAHAGFWRHHNGDLNTWVCSARAATYVLRTLVACGKRGLLAPMDAATLYDYLIKVMLPAWEAGVSSGKGGITQVYNGELGWTAPALWDFIRSLTPAQRLMPDHLRLYHVLYNWCARLALLEYLKPGKGCQTEKVDAWEGLTAEGITTTWYYGPTLVRSFDVAGAVLNMPSLRKAALDEASRWEGVTNDTYDIQAFLVGADMGWLVAPPEIHPGGVVVK